MSTVDNGAAERRVKSALSAIGRMPMIIARAVIKTRPEPGEAGVHRRGHSVGAFRKALAGEADDKNAVGGRDAHAHDRAR